MNIVIVNCFDTYEHRVDLLHEVFIEDGHMVKVFTSDFKHFEKVKRKEYKLDYCFFEAQPYYKNLSFQRLLSHRNLSKDIFRYLEKESDNVDLLWVLVPPNSFVKDAAEYKKKHRSTKLIFDLIDLWPETMPIGSVENVFPFSAWKNLRDKHIRNADVVVTECKLYQQKLKKVLQGINIETLYLARHLVPYEPHLTLPDDRISLCYLGSINNIIDIDEISKIIKEISIYKPVELHIIGDGERKDELISSAENVGATIVFHGKVFERVEKQRIFDSCHYGLNIMKESVCVGLTMKSMDYMEFGLPMINNIKGDTWEIIQKKGIGINVGATVDYGNLSREIPIERQKIRNYFEKTFGYDAFRTHVNNILT